MKNHDNDFEWNDIYTGDAKDYMEPDGQLLEIIDTVAPGRALDIGCGAGGLVVAMLERGWEVTGMDIAPKAIEAARKVLDARGLHGELVVADAAKWRPNGKFDLITNSFALPTTKEEQAALFQTIRGSLAPGGRVLIKDFDASMQSRKEFARFHCPTVDELVAAFDGFLVLRACVNETPSHDHGHGHHQSAEQGPPTAALFYARRP